MIFEGRGVCKDCGQPFTWTQVGGGGPRQICDICRRAKKRAKERPRKARKAQRRKEENAAFEERLNAIVERAQAEESS